MLARHFTTIAFCQFLFGISVVSALADAGDETLKKLQGTWTVVSGDRYGTKLTDEEAREIKVNIAGNKLTIARGSRNETVTIKLDPSKTPAWIDFILERNGQTTSMAGIYMFEGGIFQFCYHKSIDGTRPTDFSGGEPSRTNNIIGYRLKRQKSS